MERGKSYTVKEWFANKVANEVRKNISMCDVFAVLKETEKAIYAMLNIGCNERKTMWVPKSVLVESNVGQDENLEMHYETLFIEDYEKAVEQFEKHWELFI